ncbi:MAG: glycosyltransferase [Desulfobacterales bacterium]|jgi:GR25 family glycosyltransferase involved in LPS biosynthesis
MMTMRTDARGWDYFDRFYCISLAEREDRRENARRQFGRVGLADRVEFMIVDRNPEGSEAGIYESHMACFRKGLGSGARRMVVFEDDIVFDQFCPQRLAACTQYLTQTPQWHLLFLGCLVSGSRQTSCAAVRSVRYRCLAHGYGVSREYAQTLVRKPWSGVPFDAMLAGLDGTPYVIYPSIAFQSNSPSDNRSHRILDRVRRIFGGLQIIQKVNERYHRHRRVVLILHLLGILSLGALLF